MKKLYHTTYGVVLCILEGLCCLFFFKEETPPPPIIQAIWYYHITSNLFRSIFLTCHFLVDSVRFLTSKSYKKFKQHIHICMQYLLNMDLYIFMEMMPYY